ncbi:MAG TPA: hypothetical protein VFP39_07195 [Gemmatimonadales bacterium]|nr:hypothetical protein [Gemmatimonadales bacterium]
MNWLYSLAQPFVGNPARAVFVALGWILIALLLPKAARRPLFAASIAWNVFAFLELEAGREHADIRVDLLFSWPALCILTLFALAVSLRRIVRQARSNGGEAA